jgi:L-ascorbate metabolism protein UlaG (beta-lactamase superfamily)
MFISILFSVLFFNSALGEDVKVTWLGVAGLKVTDGITTILIDPVFTKPSLSHWILNSKFRSNKELVQSSLKTIEVTSVDAIFSSHTHFDHAVDLIEIANQTKATIFGGVSIERMIYAEKNDKTKYQKLNDRDEVNIGQFKIISYRRSHAPILHSLDWKFLPGEIYESFSYHFYDYREGEIWSYRIEHPKARLIVDQGSHLFEENKKYKNQTDAYFVGVANKKSLDDLVQNNIAVINAPKVIPLHFDFFLLQSSFLESLRLPGNGLEKLQEKVKEHSAGNIQVQIPNLYEEITISYKTI